MAAREKVEMKMKHRLSSTLTIIDHHAVTAGLETFFLSDLSGGKKQMPDKLSVRFGHAVNIGDMIFWNNKRVGWRLRVNILESHDVIILKENP
jgi:hypothetical protein